MAAFTFLTLALDNFCKCEKVNGKVHYREIHGGHVTLVETTVHGKVLEIVFDRPPANAINRQSSYDLYEAFKRLRDDPDLMVGILVGGGDRFFSAGWDLKEIASGDELAGVDEIDLGPGGLGGITEFFDLGKPVIAAVNGFAVGGGFEIALAADIVVAAEHAEFFLPEMQRGFLPDSGGVQRLARRLPYNVAIDLMFTGRRMSAAEAKHWGFVRDVVPAERLLDHCRALAGELAVAAPLALQALKEVMATITPLSIEDAFKRTRLGWQGLAGMPIYEKMIRSADYSEGPRAFAEKRKPIWKGR
jgi:crotonobetainyl-CoA hydratase